MWFLGNNKNVSYNTKKRMFTVKMDKDTAKFFEVMLSAVPSSVGLKIKGTTLTFIVKDETLAMPVLEMLKASGNLK